MTKEERVELRELCERATPGEWIANRTGDAQSPVGSWYVIANDADDWHFVSSCSKNDAKLISTARQALPALLDLVDEMERDHWLSVNAGADAIKQLKKQVAEIRADRDRWKTRAQALERAFVTLALHCATCIHEPLSASSSICTGCMHNPLLFANWEFDEKRFAGGNDDAG
jgi:hypothetical protein